jgi:hypothetical protein
MAVIETLQIRDITDTWSNKKMNMEVPVKLFHAEYFENILKYWMIENKT